MVKPAYNDVHLKTSEVQSFRQNLLNYFRLHAIKYFRDISGNFDYRL
jgi:hypothetical protein